MIDYEKQSFCHRDKIKPDTECGCFYCLSVFKGEDIRTWADKGETAMCPVCGIDTVLPGVSDFNTLQGICTEAFHDGE